MKTSATLALLAVLAMASATPAWARGPDGAEIRNSGSTNAAAFTIKVWSNGSTSLAEAARSGAPDGQVRSGKIPSVVAVQFLSEAAAARREETPGIAGCMKSASFGSATTVLWHGWASADLTCPQSGTHARALAATTAQIIRMAFGGLPGRSVHLPINEPRRAPVEGTPAPHPSPNAR